MLPARQDSKTGISYLTAQILGGVLGAALAMFSLPGMSLAAIMMQLHRHTASNRELQSLVLCLFAAFITNLKQTAAAMHLFPQIVLHHCMQL